MPFFSSAAAPHIHPFVIPSAESAAVQVPSALAPSILFDRLANAGRLNQVIAGGIRQSMRRFRLALRREGLFFQGRRADATVVSRRSPCAIFKLLGETESGSAGEQPDKGSSSQGRVKDAGCRGFRAAATFFHIL